VLHKTGGEKVTFARTASSTLLDMPFADRVRVSHDPPLDTDGPVDGARLSAIALAETQALERAFARPPERQQSKTVEGRFVTMRNVLRGVLVDGSAVDYQTEVALEIDNGVIVAIRSRMDAASMAQHRRALEAGNFQRPTG
jgi:hypothetical protein